MELIYHNYQAQNREACLAVFDSNRPLYFADEERPMFADFLDRVLQKSTLRYLVMELEGEVVGCGGVGLEEDRTLASLCWGMIRRDKHRRGIGRVLTQERIEAAQELGATRIRCATSQLTEAFYARFGFETEKREAEGFGPGLDRIDMMLTL